MIKLKVNLTRAQLAAKASGAPTVKEKGMGFARLESGQSEYGFWAMLDTGSCFNLSGSTRDFSYIQKDPTVSITAVDGDVNGGNPCGFVGRFRPNSLGLKYGVFFPLFGEETRIISGKSLVRINWEIILNDSDTSRLASGEDSIPIAWGTDQLPYLSIKFGDSVKGGSPKRSGLASKVRKRINVRKMSNTEQLALHKAAGHLSIPGI